MMFIILGSIVGIASIMGLSYGIGFASVFIRDRKEEK
jgi:hypothetical protein